MTNQQILFPEAWQDLYNTLPPMASRQQIADLSNLVARGTLANRDSLGTGISGRMIAGKKTVYPRKEAVLWLMSFVKEQDNAERTVTWANARRKKFITLMEENRGIDVKPFMPPQNKKKDTKK